MYQIDQEKFGKLISERRRAKGMTQNELAEKLYVSDKAVSKWERGISLPNVALLIPLSEVIDIPVSKLLGQDSENNADDTGIQKINNLSLKAKRIWKSVCVTAALSTALEVLVLLFIGREVGDLRNIFILCGIMFIFCVWASFFAPDLLPLFYDREKMNYFVDGPVRMHMIGLHFNNNNWWHIRNSIVFSTAAILVLWPLCSIAFYLCKAGLIWVKIEKLAMLIALVCMVISIYIAGKKYE